MAPRLRLSPSPNSTRTLERFAPVVGVTVKTTGVPAVVAEGLAWNPLKPRTLTVTVVVPETVPAVAVTFDVPLVVSVAAALPFESVLTVDGDTAPLSVENVTGTPPTGLPPSSVTVAITWTDPPFAPSDCGTAVTVTVFAAAVPTFSVVDVDAPPENAVIVAVPLAVSVMSVTVTSPLCVRASAGSIRPSVVVKVTTVPFWTGVPAAARVVVVVPDPAAATPFSITVATIVTRLLRETDVVCGKSEMTLPVGASSGTLSHAAMKASGTARRAAMARRCVTIIGANDSSLMSLRGQHENPNGYAMAALLVALAVMSIMMSVVLPVWRHEAQREKEEELVFRGLQYVRAIRLYQAKMRTLPPGFDALVDGHFIRKRYKDPITNDDFEPLGAAQQAQPGAPGQTGQPGGRGPAGNPFGGGTSQPAGALSASSGMVPGGLMGVRSKSKDESIRVYQGRNHYNEWAFVFVNQQPVGPGGPGGRGGPNGRGTQGGPGGGPFGPGRGGPGRGGPDGRGGPPDGRGRGIGPGVNPFPFPGPGGGRGRGGGGL
jgi:type II secretory pathway pseudopilin PulG